MKGLAGRVHLTGDIAHILVEDPVEHGEFGGLLSLLSRLFIDQDLVLLRLLAERLNRSELLGELPETALQLLDDWLGFHHAIILLADERNGKLFTIASRGYLENGVGSEVGFGAGLIGMVARARRALRLSAIDHSLRYARTVRDRAEAATGAEAVCREIPLPGLPRAACQIVVPLVTRSRMIGVLAVESTDPLAFMPREDTILTIIAAQLATGIEQTRPRYGRVLPYHSRTIRAHAHAHHTTT